MNYVAGFLFDETRQDVLLMEKRKPEWQKGKLNGIGGKIEDGESPLAAMMRECEEEIGLSLPVDAWREFCVLGGAWGKVHFFVAVTDLDRARAQEEEPIRVCRVEYIRCFNTIDNLQWLIPMATATSPVNAEVEEINDEPN